MTPLAEDLLWLTPDDDTGELLVDKQSLRAGDARMSTPWG
jgi:hypothetical protein